MSPQKLFFGVFGDLLFYYDMNSLGNRDISSNLRIIVINNGLGQEFKNYSSYGAIFGDDSDKFIAAKGHFNGRTTPLIECYAECLGFEYLAASNKEEFLQVYKRFVDPKRLDKPLLFEIFTETEDESTALELITTLTRKGQSVKKRKELMNRPELTKLRKIAILVINVAFSILCDAFFGIIRAHERFVVSNILSTFRLVLRLLAIIILLNLGVKSIGIVITDLSITILILLFSVIYVKFKLKEKAKYYKFDKKLIVEIATFALPYQRNGNHKSN